MFEIAKIFIDTAAKVIPVAELMKRRREEELADLGLALFDFYRAVLDVAERGHPILGMLKYAAERHEYFYESGSADSSIRAGQGLLRLMAAQAESLDRVIASMRQLTSFADVAEAGAEQPVFQKLADKMPMKRFLLGHVVGTEGALELAAALAERKIDAMRDPEALICQVLTQLAPGQLPWDQKLNDVALVYVNSGLGARRLDELVDAVTLFRRNFQSVFELGDVLRLAEKRARTQAR